MNKLALALLLGLPLCACEKASHSSPPPAPVTTATTTTTATAPAGAASAATVGDDASVPRLAAGTKAKCAVTGEEFTVTDSTVQVTYDKKRYAFCCADCRPTFAKNPAKYAAK
jgi:YHS domain-containing protein